MIIKIYLAVGLGMGMLVFNACSNVKGLTAGQSKLDLTTSATFFSGNAFACTGVASQPGDGHMIGVTENSPLLASKGIQLRCNDQWFKMSDIHIGSDHLLNTLSTSDRDKLLSDPKVLGKATKRGSNGEWMLNQPECTNPAKNAGICGMKVKIQGSAYTQGVQKSFLNNTSAQDAVIYDVCPENHWNNALKSTDLGNQRMSGGSGNPCMVGATHIDIFDELWRALFPTMSVNTAEITVWFADQSPSQATSTSSTATQSTTTTSSSSGSQSSSSSSSGTAYLSCSGNQYCNNGWGWLKDGESGCSASTYGWLNDQRGCSCNCSAQSGSTTSSQNSAGQQQASQPSNSSQTQTGSSSYLKCSGNQYCSGGWGWLKSNESGCSASTFGWHADLNGCSCQCN